MTKFICSIFLCFLTLSRISSAEIQSYSNELENGRRTSSDTVSSFVSELGDLLLDVDRSIAVHSAPKVNYEDSLSSKILGPLKPRKEYFRRIQENYRTLQNRLGSLIEEATAPRRDPLSTLPPKNELKPQRIQTRQPRTHHESKDVSHEQLGVNSEYQVRKAMENLISNTRLTNEILGPLEFRALDEVGSVFARRGGDISESTDNSNPQERILGNVLFSESRFDNYIKQLLRNHGTWILDNPLLQRWRSLGRSSRKDQLEEISTEPLPAPTEDVTTASTVDHTPTEILTEAHESLTTQANEVQISEESLTIDSLKGLPIMANYYRVGDDGRIINEEIDIVLQTESDSLDVDHVENEEVEYEHETDENESQEILLLAFTPDGVPLKLRMGLEIENPLKYLHKVLRTAGVNLKIPVDSFEDLEPVGNEVFVLGAGSGIVKTVYLNLSNKDDLDSLLRILMESKISEEKY